MKLDVEELYRRAKKVAKTHNGQNYPRIVQIEAMKALQDFIHEAEAKTKQK